MSVIFNDWAIRKWSMVLGDDFALDKATFLLCSIIPLSYIEISDNKLRNGSLIANNTDNGITVYNRISTITKNNLDNNSTINSNTFVEEGKGISDYSKGINGNEIINKPRFRR